MAVGKVPEIIAVKQNLEELKEKGYIKEWELPYENILTRLTAAIFFATPCDENKLNIIEKELKPHGNVDVKNNDEKKLSNLSHQLTFTNNNE